LVITVQKIAPIILASYLIKRTLVVLIIIGISVVVGSLGGINQTSIRKILTYSSINHTGWILIALLGGRRLWILYFTIYSLLTTTVTTIAKIYNTSFINQSLITKGNKSAKYLLFRSLLSLGGLPPFIGFLPKWAVIQTIITNKMRFMITIIVIMSLATLYFYLRICYSRFIILHNETKWIIWPHKEEKSLMYRIILASVSLLGLIACTIITNIN
jgi:NADH-ubiquinone oxidoreductase chain 2